MMTSYFNLLKYAQTGIASPDMSYFDKMRASTLMGGTVQTLTGQPPLSFKADGAPLISWSMKGNGSQQGTPTPDNPVMPEMCGVRTGNLLNLNRTYSESFTTDTTKWMNGAATLNNAGPAYAETEILGDVIKVTSKIAGYGASFLIEASPNTTYTVSFETDKTSSGSWGGISDRDINGTVISNLAIQGKSATFTTHSDCAFLNVCFRFPPADGTVTFSKIMLNSGSTALPYEPYGWAEKITCAGQTTPVYLGQTQTVRRVRKYEFTGLEQWSINDATRVLYTFAISNFFATNGITCMCSHYPAQNNAAGVAEVQNKHVCFRSSTYNQFYLKDTDFDSTDALKSYLAAQYAAGTPVTVWYVLAEPETAIVNEPLAKIGDYSDELSSTDAAVTIPTAKGNNVLTIDTELQPSEVSITGNIKPTT